MTLHDLEEIDLHVQYMQYVFKVLDNVDERTDGQREPIKFLYSFKAVIEHGGIDIAIFMLFAERCKKTC